MPVVFRLDGFRFFFYSNEGNPLEPVHVHVQKAGAEAKFWVGTEIILDNSEGFDAKTLRKLLKIVKENRILIEERWYEYFG